MKKPEPQGDYFGKGTISNQQPGLHNGLVPGGSDNTSAKNGLCREVSGGAKKGKPRAGTFYSQSCRANYSDTSRGADSSNIEFWNNQFIASTLSENKGNEERVRYLVAF